jgi:trans-aconitate methyltransferase
MNDSSGSMPSSNKAIIILGMHRSGTSAFAGVLAKLGVTTGDRLVVAREDTNSRGYWEHKDVVRIDDELLLALHSSWHDTRSLPADWWRQGNVAAYRAQLRAVIKRDFPAASLWLLKDPRMCRLLPLWRELLSECGAEPRFVLSLRHPMEVARSLAKRDGMAAERASLLWLTHTLAAEIGSRGLRRVFMTYDRLLEDWRNETRRLATELDVVLPLGQPELEAPAAAFLEPSLRHHRAQADEVPSTPLAKLATRCYRLLASVPASEILERELSLIQRETDDAVLTFGPWEEQIHAARATQKNLEGRLDTTSRSMQAAIADLAGALQGVTQSRSWRYTRPLRFPSFVRRLFKRSERHKYEYMVDLNDDNTVAPKIVRMVGSERRVLELGAGPGTITRLLKEPGRCRVTAIEIDDEAIVKLAPFCENVFRCDLNDATWVSQVVAEGPFQVIVAADVLEHLRDPWSTLRGISRLLSQDGELIISLPHVGHSAVLAALAGGSFDYGDWGLLDRTHIKFFGIKNIQSLLNDSSYKITAAEFVVKHPTQTEFAQSWTRATPELKRALTSTRFGSVYQVVLKARLNPTGEKGLDLMSVPVPSAASAWRDWASS